MITKIFLDLDGVLADFFSAAIRQHGMSHKWTHANWPAGEWDMAKVMGLSPEAFWGPLDEAFWEHEVRLYDHAPVLLEALCGYNVCLLTAPGRGTASGKQRFIQREFPGFYRKGRYLIGPGKVFCAGPDTLLIDDYEKNCRNFRKAGGQAALFPRPWNSGGLVSLREWGIEELRNLGIEGLGNWGIEELRD